MRLRRFFASPYTRRQFLSRFKLSDFEDTFEEIIWGWIPLGLYFAIPAGIIVLIVIQVGLKLKMWPV